MKLLESGDGLWQICIRNVIYTLLEDSDTDVAQKLNHSATA